LDTEKVTKAYAPCWLAVASLLATTIILVVQFFLPEDFTFQVLTSMGLLLMVIISVSVIRMLIEAENSTLSEFSSSAADGVFKARSLVKDELCEFSLPEILVL